MIRHRHNAAAFTLIELLVVIAIIVILAALLIPAIGAARQAAKSGATGAQIHAIKVALQAFENEWGQIPNPTRLNSAGNSVLPLQVNDDYLDPAYRATPEADELDAGSPSWTSDINVDYDSGDETWNWRCGDLPMLDDVLDPNELDLPELLYLLVATRFLPTDDSSPPEAVPVFRIDLNDDGDFADAGELLYAPQGGSSPYLALKASQVSDLDGDGYPEIIDSFGNPLLFSVGVRGEGAEVWSMGPDGEVDYIDADGDGTWDAGEHGNNGHDDDGDGLTDEKEDEINHQPELRDDIVSW